jgi:hypothetical protein
VAETNGLLNRRTGNTVPRVRIPASPQIKMPDDSRGFFIPRNVKSFAFISKGRLNRRTGNTVPRVLRRTLRGIPASPQTKMPDDSRGFFIPRNVKSSAFISKGNK